MTTEKTNNAHAVPIACQVGAEEDPERKLLRRGFGPDRSAAFMKLVEEIRCNETPADNEVHALEITA